MFIVRTPQKKYAVILNNLVSVGGIVYFSNALIQELSAQNIHEGNPHSPIYAYSRP